MEQPTGHWEPRAMNEKVKGLLFLIAVPVVGFVAFVIIFVISELVSDDEYYASRVGLSLRECLITMRTFGVLGDEAQKNCSEHVPKKKQ
jgi:hypothetical protein